MKKVSSIFILLLGLGSISNAQTVTIGTQVWMTKNLDVSTFRNGDPIPEAKTDEEWERAGKLKQPAWCYYDNDTANGAKYGKLYNWYAVNDSRGLAPVGYHIPTDAEWTKLTDFLGGEKAACTKMKSKSGWNSVNTGNGLKSGNGTNTSGFSGLPGGVRYSDGTFDLIGKYSNWWSSTEYYAIMAWYCYLSYGYGNVNRNLSAREWGFSVRCVKD